MIDENYTTFYWDGIEVRRMETTDPLRTPLYPLVTFALGPGWPLDKTPSPSCMYVDYIKIYSKN